MLNLIIKLQCFNSVSQGVCALLIHIFNQKFSNKIGEIYDLAFKFLLRSFTLEIIGK